MPQACLTIAQKKRKANQLAEVSLSAAHCCLLISAISTRTEAQQTRNGNNPSTAKCAREFPVDLFLNLCGA